MDEPQSMPDSASKAPDVEAERAARLLEAGLAEPASAPQMEAPPSAEEIRAAFPQLEILELLGQGGMGVVYRARQRRLDRIVALKVMPRALSEDPAFAERFVREARTLARLDHPHIVRIHEFGEQDGFYHLVMEHVDGASLRQVMDEGRLGPAEALAIVPQVCDALQYAHDQGVVHRDVKPGNILLDARGRVKIADFGLAKLVETEGRDPTLTGTRQVMGTWQYMAPEQYRTPQDVDHRADIFSLGVVFYEMLTGELPVGHYQQPSEGNDLDQRIDGIVMRALEREREQRYQQAGEVKDDVAQLDEEAPETQTPPPVDATEGPRRGGWNGLIGAGVTFLLGVLAALVSWWITYGWLGEDHREAYLVMAITGTLVWGCGVALAMLGGLIGYRRGLGAGAWVVAAVLACFHVLAIPTIWVLALDGTQDWSRHVAAMNAQRAAAMRTLYVGRELPMLLRGRPDPQVAGRLDPAEALEVKIGVLQTFNRWVQYARDGDLQVHDLSHLYTKEDVSRLGDTQHQVLETQGPAGGFGLGLVSAETLGIPPHYLAVEKIEMGRFERTAKVTASARWKTKPFDAFEPAVVVTFPMRRDGKTWLFAIGEVVVQMDGP